MYGEDENKFIFYNTIVGRKAKARFRIDNPNKVREESDRGWQGGWRQRAFDWSRKIGALIKTILVGNSHFPAPVSYFSSSS